MGEAKIRESVFQESLVNVVIGLLRVYFISHFALLLLRFLHGMDNLLKANGIICHTSPLQEAALERAYQIAENRPISVHLHFSKNLVDCVA